MTKAPQHENRESGFLLLGAVVMVALVLIALAVAAPLIGKSIRRDKEVESEHRAQQYVRAIRLYQRKFPNQYPPSIEALEKSNNIRFLRQQYVDPLTGKADWRIIHVGENKTTVKGFFGEPLGGLNGSGVGGAGLGSASGMASGGSASGTTTVGSTNGLAAGFGGATVGTPGSAGAAGTGSSTSAFGSGGGAGPIMGVGSSRSGSSILTPNEQGTYETWEFLYDPRIEQMYAKGALNGGVGSQNASSFGKDAASGQSNSGNGTSSSPGGSGSGSGSTTPR